jgi:hypothetical protein
MTNANIPCLMEILNLMADVHAKRQLEALKLQAKALRQQLHGLEQRHVTE